MRRNQSIQGGEGKEEGQLQRDNEDPEVLQEIQQDVSEALVYIGGNLLGLSPLDLHESSGLHKLVSRNMRWIQNTPDWMKLIGMLIAKKCNNTVQSRLMILPTSSSSLQLLPSPFNDTNNNNALFLNEDMMVVDIANAVVMDKETREDNEATPPSTQTQVRSRDDDGNMQKEEDQVKEIMSEQPSLKRQKKKYNNIDSSTTASSSSSSTNKKPRLLPPLTVPEEEEEDKKNGKKNGKKKMVSPPSLNVVDIIDVDAEDEDDNNEWVTLVDAKDIP